MRHEAGLCICECSSQLPLQILDGCSSSAVSSRLPLMNAALHSLGSTKRQWTAPQCVSTSSLAFFRMVAHHERRSLVCSQLSQKQSHGKCED